jgi:hypothetical protein
MSRRPDTIVCARQKLVPLPFRVDRDNRGALAGGGNGILVITLQERCLAAESVDGGTGQMCQ